jgi:hypothetical protein
MGTLAFLRTRETLSCLGVLRDLFFGAVRLFFCPRLAARPSVCDVAKYEPLDRAKERFSLSLSELWIIGMLKTG